MFPKKYTCELTMNNKKRSLKKDSGIRQKFGKMLMALVLVALIPGIFADSPNTQTSQKIPELILVGPPGPMAIPLAYIAENHKLDDITEKTSFRIWENQDQLRAIVAGDNQADFVTMPSNAASTFYNKGTDLKLLDISIWGILYVISTDPEIRSFEDLKGREVVVPFKGDMPDLLFQHICSRSGIDTSQDLTLFYATSPQQAAQLLLSGEKDCAILTEPLVTQVMMKGKQAGIDFHRCIDVQSEWNRVSGLPDRIPIAGTVALGPIRNNRIAVDRFMEEYARAVDWIQKNPDEAGNLGASITQLGFEAKPVSESIKNTRWSFIPVSDCRSEIESFYTTLADQDPKIIGGSLPGDDFYYGAEQ